MYSFINLFFIIFFCVYLIQTSTSHEDDISNAVVKKIEKIITETGNDEHQQILIILKRQLSKKSKNQSDQEKLHKFKQELQTFIEQQASPAREALKRIQRLLQNTTDTKMYLMLLREIKKEIKFHQGFFTRAKIKLQTMLGRIIPIKNENVRYKLKDGYIYKGFIKHIDPNYGNIIIPKEFDARKEWTNCSALIGTSIDEGHYPNDFASVTCGAFADRLCIKSGGEFKELLSVEEVSFCCQFCRPDGELYGSKIRAWTYLRDFGTVTGGDYHTKGGCQPYTVEPCVTENGKYTCTAENRVAKHSCSETCYGNPNINKVDDRHRAKNVYSMTDIKTIQKDIMTYGPVTASFVELGDFYSHPIGDIYKHRDCSDETFLSHVKIIGWGEEDDEEYWLCVHIYGNFWKDHGTFKIARDTNECLIETSVFAGEA